MLASLECHEFLYLYLCCSELLQLQTSRKINHAEARTMVTKLSRHPSSSQAWDYVQWWQQQIQATVRELPTKSTENYTNHQTTCNQILSPFYFFCGITSTKAPAGDKVLVWNTLWTLKSSETAKQLEKRMQTNKLVERCSLRFQNEQEVRWKKCR
jgi:hypothetical protein